MVERHPVTQPKGPESAFEAWTVPGLMVQWLFKSPDNKIAVPLQELVNGGKYSILEMTAGNEKIDHFGTYLAIVPGELLSFTLEVPWHFPGVTTVVIHFKTAGEGYCLMDFKQSGVDPKIVTANWQTMFTQLKSIMTI